MYASLMRSSGDLLADFDDLQRRVAQLFDAPRWPASIRAVSRGAFPPVNVGATPEAIEVYAFAPGIDTTKVDVSVDRGLLTIAGERKADIPAPGSKASVYARERFTGPFRRVINLPEDSDPTAVSATYRDGVLRVVVPKREASKPRRIDIK